MPWHFDPGGDTFDMYDHNGEVVATGRSYNGAYRQTDDGYLASPRPPAVDEVLRENLEGNQPSAYNQELLAAAATNDIKVGTPP